jgi:adenylate cyclase
MPQTQRRQTQRRQTQRSLIQARFAQHRLSQARLTDLRTIAVAVPAAVVVGTVYSLLHDRSFSVALADGGLVGGLICATLISVQVFGLAAAVRRRLRRVPTALHLTLALAGSLAVVLAALQIGEVTGNWAAGHPLNRTIGLADILFSLGISAVFVAVTELDRMVGYEVLLGIFTGRYLTPRAERRVFLFADLASSTALAERVGDVAFHRYLDDLFCELAEPISRHRGRIYRYVGDEVIVTWKDRGDGRAVQQALACVRACALLTRRRAGHFEAAYGAAPRLRFALHAGPVVTGKMGDMKREIVFLGDTVNTAARLEETARQQDCDLVLSQTVLDRLEPPAELAVRPLPHAAIRGKAASLAVYAIDLPDTNTGRPHTPGAAA